MVKYVTTRSSWNAKVIILHFFSVVYDDKIAHFGSVILASDWVRVWIWNVNNVPKLVTRNLEVVFR